MYRNRFILLLTLLWLPYASIAQQGAPRIVNGFSTFDWPSTVSLNAASSGFSFCSGTLVGCETVITAAHCVCQGNGSQCQLGGTQLDSAASMRVTMQNGKAIGVDQIFVPTNYVFGSAADIAVLKLSEPVTGITPMPINSSLLVPFGTSGTIVGYGRSRQDLADNGVKREGQIISASCGAVAPNSEHICWSYTTPPGPVGLDSNTCSGDSGGPLFMQVNGIMTLAGVTSGGINDCHLNDLSYDTDVYVNRVFIQDKAGSDLNSASCGALPPVGTAGTTVVNHSGQFTALGQQFFHQINVPTGINEIRFVLNGEQAPSNDMDLYVKAGSAPTLTSYDCRPFQTGNFEDCIFSNPSAGTWHVMARLFAGSSGEYQLATTLFGSTACVPSFTDVPCNYWAYNAIEKMLPAAITSGCGNNNYCPTSNVTRAQMAIFMLRGINGGAYSPPTGTGAVFNDVSLGSFAMSWIEQFAAVGITAGCGNGNYCPNSNVTRAQMAVFLLRAKHGATYTPPAATGTKFNDVGINSFAAAWIEQLANEGITAGCGNGNFCPNASVSRAEMAVFIDRTFAL